MERKYLMTGFGYAIVGLLLGMHMAASHNHVQMPTHAHIMLVGFVVSVIYAIAYKLWLPADSGATGMGKVQYWAHQLGTLGLIVGLYSMYSGMMPGETIGPVLGVFSLITFIGLVLMKVMLIKATKAS